MNKNDDTLVPSTNPMHRVSESLSIATVESRVVSNGACGHRVAAKEASHEVFIRVVGERSER